MNELYSISNDATELLAGTSNSIMQAYTEAADVTKATNVSKSVRNLQKFTKSIQRLIGNKDHLDPIINQSKGKITAIKDYKTIKESLQLITKQIPNNKTIADLNRIHQYLVATTPDYADGYKYRIKLITLEYESMAVLLIHGITMVITTNLDVDIKNGHGTIKVVNTKKVGGVLSRSISDAARALTKDHTNYLKELVKLETKDRAVTEGVAGTVNALESILGSLASIYGYGRKAISGVGSAVKTLVRTAFGIVPLIRTVVYYHFKGKVNTIQALEQQAAYIEMNVELLKNQKSGDPKKKAEIIKKQEAYAKAYRKKAEKIRVSLLEGEKQTANALAEDKSISEPTGDDDLILD